MEIETAIETIAVRQVPPRTLFVFGDSLSDTGNVFNLTSALGNPFPPSPPYFDGRFSNGPVAVEILAEQLDLSLSQDTNFAWGGAKTGWDNINDNPDLGLELPGLLDQIDSFAEAIDAVGADPEALYVVWAGGNDFLPIGGAEVPADPEAAVTNSVRNIATAVTTLADLGAEKIVVPFLPPIYRVPLAIASGDVEVLADITVAFNAELSETLTSLEEELEDVDVILADLFAISEEVASNPQEFGFSNITDPFVSGGMILDETANVEEFFFWDAVHPTTNGHEIYAEVLAAEITRPVASDDRIVTPQATPVAIDVLSNDSDPLDDPLEIADFDSTTANGGAIAFDDRGNLLYSPDPEFTGMDSFEYTVTDGEGNTDIATVRVTVTAGIRPPQEVNLIRGNSADDRLIGTQTADIIISFGGDDTIDSMSGDDIIFAGPGTDNLTGGMGNDMIFGGRGSDFIQGGAGDDTISGESGRDILLGGPGSDVFVLDAETAVVNRIEADVLVDFDPGQDAIGLTGGLTADNLMLESLGTNTIVKIGDSNLILGMVNRRTPDELNGSFILFDLEVF
ncbi:MAG: cadherin-like domain-containing protein [Hormoscilla sp. GUM202]|nr:cadherin-like domain-containing protein [Hormoscilla sp. GUM202]